MTQPPVPPNQPPGPPYQNGSGQLPYQPGAPFGAGPGGPPFPPGPPKRSRGPLLIVGGLVLLLVLVVGTAVVLIANRGDGKPSATESTAAHTKPSDPKAVEFRRVLDSKAGTCPSPAAAGTACDDDGMIYTLGKVELDGSHVSQVKAGNDPAQGTTTWSIAISLDDEGAKLFGELTASLAKQSPPANQLAIVVHGSVVSAPTVQSAIPGGQIQISGNFTRADAEALAKQITG
jgi:preprotein translocase subunit SecD